MRRFVLAIAVFLAGDALFAQVPTGVPQFGSFQHGPIDTVNLATLNVHFEIPIREAPGRGLPFSAILNEENSHYSPVYVINNRSHWGFGWSSPPAPGFFYEWPARTLVPLGIPAGNSVTVETCGNYAPWGGDVGSVNVTNNVLTVSTNNDGFTVGETVQFSGLTYATFLNGRNVTVASVSPGYFTASFSHANYDDPVDTGAVAVLTNLWNITGYTDIHNTGHWAGPGIYIDPYGCLYGSTSGSYTSQDGYITTAAITGLDSTGYTLTVTVTTPSGIVINSGSMRGNTSNGGLAITNPSAATDTNGNQISVTNGPSLLSYTDATGNNILNVTPISCSFIACGATYSYTGPISTAETASVTSTSTNIQTSFGCPGIAEFSYSNYRLVNSISLPDGSSYQIGNDTAGRISSVTLPTGGAITYDYNGPNGGISCQDGGSSGFTRTTPDGTWTYARSYSTGTGVWTTTVTDPQGNNTVYTFSGPNDLTWIQANGFATIVQPKYEVQRQVYQLVNGNQVLTKTVLTCYNGNFTNCATATVTEPITQIDRYTYLPGVGNPSLSETRYNNSEILTEDKEFDFNAALPPGNNQVSDRVIQYGTYNGGSCATLGQNLLNRPCTDTTIGGGSTASETTYQYDANGNLLSLGNLVSGSAFLTKSFSYYSNGLINVATDVNGATTTYTYGACNGSFPTSIAIKVNTQLTLNRSMAWDCTGETPTSVTDENNQATTYSYVSSGGTADPFWRVLQENFPDGGQTSWTYNTPTSTTTTTKMNSSQSIINTVLLDSLGRTSQTQVNSDPQGVDYVDTTYDSRGLVHSVSNPHRSGSSSTDGVTTYSYDALGRVTSVILQDGSIATTSYNGNTVTTTDPAGKTRQSTFDGLGRLTQVIEDPGSSPHLNYVTAYGYDALGNITNVTQNGGRGRTYSYDGLSRLTSETNPEAGTTTYAYDSDSACPVPNSSAGDLIKRIDARSIRTCYQYDALHRITATNYSDGTPSANFTYDATSLDGHTLGYPLGHLVKAATSDGLTATWDSYDTMGRIANQWECTPLNCGGTPYSKTFALDLLGNHTSETYSYTTGTLTISYTPFDGAGRPTQVTSSLVDSQHPATLATIDPSTGYYSNGAIRKLTFGNGLTQFAQISSRDQLCQLNLNSSGSTLSGCGVPPPSGTVQDFQYTYGNWGSTDNGNLTSWVASGTQNFNRSYTFDSLNRLAAMSAPGDACSGLSWTVDAWGNRTDQTVTGGTCYTFHASINGNNQFIESPYTYDAAGNMTHDASHSYTFDAENRVTQVDAGSTSSYVYDAFGRRARKTTVSGTVDYLHDLSNNVFAYFGPGCGGTGCWDAGAIYLNGQFLAEYLGSTYFVTADHLGSSRILTALDQSIYDSMDYLPFGEQIAGGQGTNIRFAGLERDDESTLDRAQFRQYSSSLGRWMRPDPAGLAAVDPSNPQSWNRYAYALNNPLIFKDPTGLYCYYGDTSEGSTDWEDDSQYDFKSSPSECHGTDGIWYEDTWNTTTTVVATADPLPSGNSSWWGAFASNLFSWQNAKQAQIDAWNKGYYKTVNNCAGQLSQAGSVSNLSGGRVPEVLGSNTFGDIATLATGGGGLDQGAALAADATAHAAPAIATQVAVGTVTSIGKAISNTPGVYNPVTVGITTRTVGMTTAGKVLLGAAEGLLTGKVLLDAGVYVGALVVCSQ